MITKFSGLKVSGVVTVLPENEYLFDEETKHLESTATRRLKRIMGFNKRRAAKANTTASELALYGVQYLLQEGLLKKEEIGALLVLGDTPDYYMPPMSNIIHGKLDLPFDVVCMDICQACAAYITGMYQAGLLLEHLPAGKKVVSCTSTVLCRKDPAWKLREPSFGGDAATVTILEKREDAPDSYFNIYNDGSRREALIIHAGGFKMPRTPETAIREHMVDGKLHSYNELWMDGSAVFNFMQREVPPMIEEILQFSGRSKDEIDWYLFHQPNKFMLQKLTQRLSLPTEKVPMNVVENFGNSSGSCVGVNITYNLGEKLLTDHFTCCMAGFGGGLSWGSAVMELGKLDFCRMIVSNL